MRRYGERAIKPGNIWYRILYKWAGCLFLILMSLLLFTKYSLATPVYIDDSFNNMDLVDVQDTTAEIETTSGWVTLAKKNMGNSLLLERDSFDVAIINGNLIETYGLHDLTMKRKTEFSILTGLSDPRGVSGEKGSLYVLDRGKGKILSYQFDGQGMIENPQLGLSSLNNPLLFQSAANLHYWVVEGRRVKGYSFGEDQMFPNGSISFQLDNSIKPISSAAPRTGLDLILADSLGSGVSYYHFEGGEMVFKPDRSITEGLLEPKSVSLDSEGFFCIVADGNQVKAYLYQGEEMVYTPQLSIIGLSNPIAVAIKPGSYAYAVLCFDEGDNPQVKYFAFDGTAMVELELLRIQGLNRIPYGNYQTLKGKGAITEKTVRGLSILADVDLPPHTDITWEVSVDNETWYEALNDGPPVRFIGGGHKPNYRAVLSTAEQEVTPKIHRVRLVDASLWMGNLQITDIVGPILAGNPPLPTSEQVSIWAGYNVSFQIETRGGVESIKAIITGNEVDIVLDSELGNITPIYPLTEDLNLWEATFHTGPAVSKDTFLDMELTAYQGEEHITASCPDFAVIRGSALENHPIHLTH